MGLGALRRVNAFHGYLSLMGDSGELTQVTRKAGEPQLLISQGEREGEAASSREGEDATTSGARAGSPALLSILYAVLHFQFLCQEDV